MRPTRLQWIIAGALLAALVLTFPFAREPVPQTAALVPAYAGTIAALETMTAVLLLALFYVQRAPALLLLAAGYLFSALLVPAWALSFPGVFDGFGFDFGIQTTAAIAALRRLGFPLFVLGFALAPSTPQGGRIRRTFLLKAVALVVAGTGLAVALIFTYRDALPPFMQDARNVTMLWVGVPFVGMALYGLNLGILARRRRSPLDIWVCLVIFSLAIELALLSFAAGGARLSVGWWAGRLYGLIAASLVILALLFETTTVYVRLAATMSAERRARQNRLTAMEALSGAIAHEINQPLASMVTNADAALRWLGRDEPRLDRAEAALRRIVEDGHRANKVVTGIRTMFSKGTQERVELDLNALVAQAAEAAQPEARQDLIEVRLALDPTLPPVVGNPVQLDQVLRNLIDNAFDSIRSAGDAPRLVILRTLACGSGPAPDEAHVAVCDTGAGIAESVAERLFEPFVSTKPGGMGMGLMFCRAVIEAHGGRLWSSPNDPRGAVFHFALPTLIFPPETETATRTREAPR